jgi:Zn ribbon nucleic-acid-binding protein
MAYSENCLVAINCPVCSGNNNEKLYTVFHNQSTVLELLQLSEKNEAVDIVACKKCGHHYMNPVISQELINRYYSVLNSEYYHNSKNHNQTKNHNFKEYAAYAKIIKSDPGESWI